MRKLNGKKRIREIGIKRMIFLALSVAALVPLLLFALPASLFITLRLSRTIESDNALFVDTVKREIEKQFTEARESLSLLSEGLSGSMQAQNPIPCDKERLSQFITVTPWFNRILVLDQSGTVIATVPEETGILGNNYGRSDHVTALREGKGYYFSESLISPDNYRPVVLLAVPFRQGTVAAYLDLSRITGIAESVSRRENRSFLLTDHLGTVVASNISNLAIRRTNLSNISIENKLLTFQGERWIVHASDIRPNRWSFLLLTPEEELFSGVRTLAIILISITLVLLPLGVLYSLFISRRIAKPLEELTKKAEQVGRGEYQFQKIENSFRETTILGNSMLQMAREIEEREEELRKSEVKYRELLENAATLIFRWDGALRYTYYNEYAAGKLGLSPGGEDIGAEVQKRMGEGCRSMMEAVWHNPETLPESVCTIPLEDGTSMKIQWNNRPLYDEQGNLQEILSAGSDITVIEAARENLAAALEEREALLKEVHHRVKNNLQIVISLLNLKTASMDPGIERESLIESTAHIHSIAMVHEQIHMSKNLSAIDLKDYTEAMVSWLNDTYRSGRNPVSFYIQIDDIQLNLDAAVPCGLIMMECTANALRHGLGAEKGGEIQIIGLKEEGSIQISIGDSGPGFPEEWFSKPASLGFQMIQILAKQLKGNISYTRKPKSTFALHLQA